jgi:cytochrome c5
MSVEHENFIKTPKQLIIIVTLSFIVPIAFISLLSQLMTSDKKCARTRQGRAREPDQADRRARHAGPKVLLTGDKVFETLCTTCHTPGSPARRNSATRRLGQIISAGRPKRCKQAITGVKGMPPRGGNPDLTDEEVAGPSCTWPTQAAPTGSAPS